MSGCSCQRSQGRRSVADGRDAIAFGHQVELDAGRQVQLVLDDQDMGLVLTGHGFLETSEPGFGAARPAAHRQFDLEHRARPRFTAADANPSAQLADQGVGDMQAQPGAGLVAFQFGPQPHETPKHFVPQPRRNPPPVVRDPDHDRSGTVAVRRNRHLRHDPRILDRVVQQVPKDQRQIARPGSHVTRLEVEMDHLQRDMVVRADRFGALLQQLGDVHVFDVPVGAPGLQSPGVQHLVDQAVQPFHVVQHHPVELRPFGLADLAAGERLQVQLHRRDRGFQLVRDAVDKVGLPTGQVDRLDRQHQVQNHPDQKHHDEGRAHRQQDPVPAGKAAGLERAEHGEHDPADGEDHQQRDHHDGQDDRQSQGTSGNHDGIVPQRGAGAREGESRVRGQRSRQLGALVRVSCRHSRQSSVRSQQSRKAQKAARSGGRGGGSTLARNYYSGITQRKPSSQASLGDIP